MRYDTAGKPFYPGEDGITAWDTRRKNDGDQQLPGSLYGATAKKGEEQFPPEQIRAKSRT